MTFLPDTKSEKLLEKYHEQIRKEIIKELVESVNHGRYQKIIFDGENIEVSIPRLNQDLNEKGEHRYLNYKIGVLSHFFEKVCDKGGEQQIEGLNILCDVYEKEAARLRDILKTFTQTNKGAIK